MENTNIKIYAGDTLTHSFRYIDSEGDPIAVTSGKMQLRRKITDVDFVIEANATMEASTGTVTFQFPPSDTEQLATTQRPNDMYIFDTEIVTADGRTLTLTKGNVSVNLSVTR